MNYVSYVSGNEYFNNYCKPFINSLFLNDKDKNQLFIYYADVNENFLKEVNDKFGKFVIFINIQDFFGKEFWSKMVIQTYCFAHFLENIAKEEDISCLIDCDTIILKKIEDDLLDIKFDIALTCYEKPHNTPYGDVSSFPSGGQRFNAGVIFTKGIKATSFFYELSGRLIFYAITNHDQVYPNSALLGPQQSTIGLMLFGKSLKTDFTKPIEFNGLNFKFLPCRIYNETESIGDISDDVKILHLKGGWRNLIPKPDWSKVENSSRRKEWSEKIYEKWRKYKW